ncbi:histone-like transcription factor family protein [Tripterygium wilfordii]|uniref:Histone-like transcription factor family protein n=1 Tax=Tripterygium wilfordii TaxID=458696 RepID=A0A7J7DEH7_TRIWF|nr:DNA polymerase epsilon subunit C-like [Tripterygium wilfordii]KAF5744694.1 histone-like transcription factor family protein [Tripterygium wilfordii]
MASTKKSREENEKKKRKNDIKESPRKSNVKLPKTEKKGIKKSSNGKASETDVVVTDGSEEQSQTPKKSSHRNQVANGNVRKPSKIEKKRKGEEKDQEFENGKEDSKLCRFPMNRIKRMVSDENPALKIKQEALFLVNKATEKFLEQFCEEAYEFSVRDRRKSLGYKQLASVVSQERRFDFLSDFVPEKVRAEDAMAERKLAEIGQGEES